MEKILAILMALGTALNVPKEKLTELLDNKTADTIDSDAVEKTFKDAHRATLEGITKNGTVAASKAKDEGYKAAERKVKGDMEALLKDKFGIDADISSLDDIVDLAVGKIKATPAKGAMTDDDIKKSPVYMQLEKKYTQDLKKAQEDAETALTSLRSEYEQKEVFGKVSEKALAIFTGMNPVLSADPAKSAKQMELVKNFLSGYKYEDKDGTIIITDKDGKLLEDELKNKVSLEAHVKALTSDYFDFKKAEERGAPNGGNGGRPEGSNGGGTMKYAGKLPTTKKELETMLYDDKIPLEQRQEISVWSDANGANLPES